MAKEGIINNLLNFFGKRIPSITLLISRIATIPSS